MVSPATHRGMDQLPSSPGVRDGLESDWWARASRPLRPLSLTSWPFPTWPSGYCNRGSAEIRFAEGRPIPGRWHCVWEQRSRLSLMTVTEVNLPLAIPLHSDPYGGSNLGNSAPPSRVRSRIRLRIPTRDFSAGKCPTPCRDRTAVFDDESRCV